MTPPAVQADNDVGIAVPPLGLYVHFPWCVAKCPYCDFNSHSLNGDVPEQNYVDALLAELETVPGPVRERPVESVFFGGGTPSLFSPAQLARLLRAISQHLNLTDAAEITLEANPGAIEHGSFDGYLAAGINRLSLGAQSFADSKLRILGRIHSADAISVAFNEARSAGFGNINLDLMYALPEQTVDEALADLDCALALKPEHLSLYQLTLEPNTVFYSRPPTLPDSDAAWEIQNRSAAVLDTHGYENYEVSAWGLPGRFCAHNLNYWSFGDYLGIGAGAHAKLTLTEGIFRSERVAHPREYLRRSQSHDVIARETRVGDADLAFEFMLNNLRLKRGFLLADFTVRTGLRAEMLRPGLNASEQQGLIQEYAPGAWRPTELGWRFLNDLQANFLPEPV